MVRPAFVLRYGDRNGSTNLILDSLGAGGMRQVFLAEHAQMRRLVALETAY
jgi:hypothetical protein